MQGKIVAEMGKSCTAHCSIGGEKFTITYKPSYKPSIDKNSLVRLQAQHPDIYDEYVSETVSRRFYVRKSLEEAA